MGSRLASQYLRAGPLKVPSWIRKTHGFRASASGSASAGRAYASFVSALEIFPLLKKLDEKVWPKTWADAPASWAKSVGRGQGPKFSIKPRFPGKAARQVADNINSAEQHRQEQPCHMHWLLWSANLRLLQIAQGSALRKKDDCEARFADTTQGLRELRAELGEDSGAPLSSRSAPATAGDSLTAGCVESAEQPRIEKSSANSDLDNPEGMPVEDEGAFEEPPPEPPPGPGPEEAGQTKSDQEDSAICQLISAAIVSRRPGEINEAILATKKRQKHWGNKAHQERGAAFQTWVKNQGADHNRGLFAWTKGAEEASPQDSIEANGAGLQQPLNLDASGGQSSIVSIELADWGRAPARSWY